VLIENKVRKLEIQAKTGTFFTARDSFFITEEILAE
jgi:hypothetical protein